MRKDKRSTKQRRSDAARDFKNHIKKTARAKMTTLKLSDKRKKKAAEQRAFLEHVSRLTGELGGQ